MHLQEMPYARPSNSGDPLKLIATNHSLKREWGRGERPQGPRLPKADNVTTQWDVNYPLEG